MSFALSKTPAQEEADCLLERLKQQGQNWPSEPALRSLSPQVVDTLLERFVRAENSRVPGTNCAALLPILGGLFGFFLFLMDQGFPIIFRVLLFIVFGISAYLVYHVLYEIPAENMRYPLFALTQTDDERVLPTLLRATQYGWGCHAEVYRGLQRLLRRVKEQHSGLLDAAAQYQLWALAIETMERQQHENEPFFNEPLALATLRALACIGNYASFEKMCRLAEKTARHGPYRRVIETARELLPHMDARLQRQTVPSTLLRAASPPSQQDMLLRAAHANIDPPEQLLRSSISEEQGFETTDV